MKTRRAFFTLILSMLWLGLAGLTFAVNPAQFGAAGWTNLALPGNVTVLAIQAHDHLLLRVASVPPRPVVFQIAARNVSDEQFPLQPAPGGGPNPNDYLPGGFGDDMGTMTIQTTRPTEEFPEDLTGDGVVGIPDFNQLRAGINKASADQ